MKKKIEKKYYYTGLGFPIELHDVEMVMIDGEYHPKIDIRNVAEKAIKDIVSQKSRLTGNQVKFIRKYFLMSLREFSNVVNESHMAIKKWEDFKDKVTNMDSNIEFVLRLHVFDEIFVGSIKNTADKFYDQYRSLINIFHVASPAYSHPRGKWVCSEDQPAYVVSGHSKSLFSSKKRDRVKDPGFKKGQRKSGGDVKL